VICANVDCLNDKNFEPKTHNQKYCCDECCRVATNKKIMEKYYEKKAIRSGQKRHCKKCNSSLSRYNTSTVCAKCDKSISTSDKEKVLRMLNDSGQISQD
jgi:hypothetical protein